MSASQNLGDIIIRAHSNRRTSDLVDVMAEDAELVEYYMDDISNPRVSRGKSEIESTIDDIMSRDMTHEVTDVVATDDKLAYVVHCTYPDGNKVLGSYMADVDENGQISRLTAQVSWTD